MSNPKPETEIHEAARSEQAETIEPARKAPWETPKMEDVSEQVMAQPYIRFT